MTSYYRSVLAITLLVFNISVSTSQISYQTVKYLGPDSSFNGEGLADPVIIPASELDPMGITLYPSANFVCANGSVLMGFHTNFYGDGLVKLTPDGSLDNTFGTGGIIRTAPFNEFTVNGIQELSDGKILVVGNKYGPNELDFYVYRLSASGAIDATFGSGGFYKYASSAYSEFLGSKILVRSNGNILIGGSFHYISSFRYPAVLSISSAGVITSSFGTSGLRLVSHDCYSIDNMNLIEQADGKIVFGMSTIAYWDYQSYSLLTRFTSAGQTDNTFNSGTAIVNNSKSGYYFDKIYSIVQLSDASLMVAGKDTLEYIANYTSTGAIKTSFGTNGKVRYSYVSKLFPSNKADRYMMVYYPAPDYDAVVAMIKEDGSIDPTFGNDGSYVVEYGAPECRLNDTTYYSFSMTLSGNNKLEVQRCNVQTYHYAFVSIPDPNFRTALKNSLPACFNASDELDINCDGVRNGNKIEVSYYQIASLEGIQYFTKLDTLDCSYNNLSSIPALPSGMKFINCRNNYDVTSLDVSDYTSLTWLDAEELSLSDLELSNNLQLKELYCSNSGLSSLDITNNTLLRKVECGGNSITVLDISSLTELRTLDCSSNQLTSLDISNNVNLETLTCTYNYLSSIAIPNNTIDVYASRNCFTTIPINPAGHTGDWTVSPNRSTCVTSVEAAQETGLAFSCYPNPSAGSVMFTSKAGDQLQWINMQGVIVKEHFMRDDEEMIDISLLNKGMYKVRSRDKSLLLLVE